MRAIPFLLLVLGCDPGASAEDDAQGFRFTPLEREIHDLVNDYRRDLGLAPLDANPVLGEVARAHSLDMLEGRVPFSHDGFPERVEMLQASLPVAGAAENIAFTSGGAPSAATVVDGWIDSPGHQENLIGPFDLGGVGVAESDDGLTLYYTHLFVRTP